MNRRAFLKTTGVMLAAGAAASAIGAPAFASKPAQKEGWPAEFRIGIFAGDDAEKALRSVEPTRAMLEQSLGIPVKAVTGTSYTAVIEAMRAGRVDGFEVGPFSYTLAAQEAGAEAVAVRMDVRASAGSKAKFDSNVKPFYYSVIFTKKGSDITKMSDLKGKNFTFVDPASTSGNLMPRAILLKNKINPDTDMKPVFAGSHPSSVIAVWNGKADAGATFEDNLYTLQNNGQVEFCGWYDGQTRKRTPQEITANFNACENGKLAILAYSDPIPNTPFAVNKAFPATFKNAVKAALLTTKDNADYIAASSGWYVDPTAQFKLKRLDNFYDPLREAAKLLNLDLKSMK